MSSDPVKLEESLFAVRVWRHSLLERLPRTNHLQLPQTNRYTSFQHTLFMNCTLYNHVVATSILCRREQDTGIRGIKSCSGHQWRSGLRFTTSGSLSLASPLPLRERRLQPPVSHLSSLPSLLVRLSHGSGACARSAHLSRWSAQVPASLAQTGHASRLA